MKALTLTQPWATLVAIGAKHIETRGWRTPYTGPLAIHAAKGFPPQVEALCYTQPFLRVLLGAHTELDKLPRGAVIATCRMTGCVPVEVINNASNVFAVSLGQISEQELAFGDYSAGRWAWILEDVKPLPEPIPARGALSLWEWNKP
jgi:hypothetical protein